MKYLYTVSLFLIFVLFGNASITNAQLSKTQCPKTCPDKQQCIKQADGLLACRETATNCKKTNGSAGCDTGKLCVKATPTSTTGTCVDDAPASAKTGTGGAPDGSSGGVGSGGAPDGSSGGGSSGGSTTPTDATAPQTVGFINPIRFNSLTELIAGIINALLGILGAITVAVLVKSGFQYMTSSNPGEVGQALDGIKNAVVGLIIIMGAFLITQYVISALAV